MENNDLIRRAEDLAARCEKSGRLTMTGFLSPAERLALEGWAKRGTGCRLVFNGGSAACERTVAFFLPEYMDGFDAAEHIRAIELRAYFGTPGHRDYMGAVLGMGVGREWVGDIWVEDNLAYIFCLPSVEGHLLGIDKVGRYSVKTRSIKLSELPEPVRQIQSRSFSLMSMRLDAVLAGMFNLSRSEAAKQINNGSVSLNYVQCMKTDMNIKDGDIISLRGSGKGQITGTGGTSRKGRMFVYADIYK